MPEFIPDGAIPIGPVEYWASLGDSENVKQAIADGNDVNATSQYGHTALHAAATNGFASIVQLLLNSGANPLPKLETGETPSDLARLAGFEDIANAIEQFAKSKR